jgi:CBS domain-containing protein
MDTDQILGLMQNYNIARVFVTDGEAIVGVVAYLDFIRAAVTKR